MTTRFLHNINIKTQTAFLCYFKFATNLSMKESAHIVHVCKSAQMKCCERSPFTFRLAEHLASAALYDNSPVRGTLQLYKIRVCLAPSSTISTSCRWSRTSSQNWFTEGCTQSHAIEKQSLVDHTFIIAWERFSDLFERKPCECLSECALKHMKRNT